MAQTPDAATMDQVKSSVAFTSRSWDDVARAEANDIRRTHFVAPAARTKSPAKKDAQSTSAQDDSKMSAEDRSPAGQDSKGLAAPTRSTSSGR